MALEITLFTDPACPFAFSAEPVRQCLRWQYGDALTWQPRMIVLTHEPGEAEKLAEGAPTLQRRFGMPIDPKPYPRPASSEPACRAVVAARLRAPGSEAALLRRLRVRTMLGGPREERRYTAPSYEIRRADGASFAVPGFNPIETYEAAIANLDPTLSRRPAPDSVTEILAWADEPLATAEVALIAGLDIEAARAELTAVADPLPAGADCYWAAG